MAWRDELQPGSFRGVPFKIDEARTHVGRRVVLNEYPLRDLPWPEDMGRLARRFQVECLVLGDDYMEQRDALIAALEAPGAGTLVHPYFGLRSVVVEQPAEIRESTREGGVARFRIQFAESGDNVQPAAATDTRAQLTSATSAASAQLADSFGQGWSLDNTPSWLSDVAAGQVRSLTDTLAGLRDSIPGIPSAVSDFNGLLQGLSDTASSLIREPANLAVSVLGLITGLGTMLEQPLDALGLYQQLFDYTVADDNTPVVISTPSRQRQLQNMAALQSLVQGAAVLQAAATVASVPAQTQDQAQWVASADSATLVPSTITVRGFDTTSSAIAMRDTLVDALQDQLLTADDDLYPQLEDVRSALVQDIDSRIATLPVLLAFTPARTLPALVVAYRLYADAGRDADIVARNALAYPGFAPGGVALEVPSD